MKQIQIYQKKDGTIEGWFCGEAYAASKTADTVIVEVDEVTFELLQKGKHEPQFDADQKIIAVKTQAAIAKEQDDAERSAMKQKLASGTATIADIAAALKKLL